MLWGLPIIIVSSVASSISHFNHAVGLPIIIITSVASSISHFDHAVRVIYHHCVLCGQLNKPFQSCCGSYRSSLSPLWPAQWVSHFDHAVGGLPIIIITSVASSISHFNHAVGLPIIIVTSVASSISHFNHAVGVTYHHYHLCGQLNEPFRSSCGGSLSSLSPLWLAQ